MTATYFTVNCKPHAILQLCVYGRTCFGVNTERRLEQVVETFGHVLVEDGVSCTDLKLCRHGALLQLLREGVSE